MRSLLWPAAIGALALWSVVAWAGYGLVPAAAGLTSAAAAWLSMDSATSALLADTIDMLVPLVEWTIVLVWALGALAIIAAPLIVRRLVRRARTVGDGAADVALSWLERRRRRSHVIEGYAHRATYRSAEPPRW